MGFDALRTQPPGPSRACRRFVVALIAAAIFSAAQAQELQVIELQYRLADEVIPILQPLVEPGGVLTGTDDMLFVRTSPANFAQIQQALAVIDRKPRQLAISVGQGTVSTEGRSAASGAVVVGGGDVQVGVNAPPAGSPGARVTVGSREQRADLQNVSTVRALEGSETYIAVGRAVPLVTTQVTPGWQGSTVQRTTEYREVGTGFYATPRVSGDTVTLEISPRQQRLRSTSQGRVIETAGAVSTVSGRLGEWIPLGAVRETDTGNVTGLLTWGRYSSGAQYSAWVRVDEVP